MVSALLIACSAEFSLPKSRSGLVLLAETPHYYLKIASPTFLVNWFERISSKPVFVLPFLFQVTMKMTIAVLEPLENSSKSPH
jgi:hypothetical protein